MADLYSISGAIELNGDQTEILKRLLWINEDQNPYLDSWLFHDGGWSHFAFFGHTVKEPTLHIIRNQLRRIAETVHTRDPDVESHDFVEGHFWVVPPDREPTFEWVVSNGQFHEYRRA